MLGRAARMGVWWYALPALLVSLIGLGTCHLVEVADPDTFMVESSVVDGTRAAVVVRHRHADSGAVVRCIWLLAAPPPAPGPARRAAATCALVATDTEMPLEVGWLAGGRLSVLVPAGSELIPSKPPHDGCYFEAGSRPARVCYMPQSIHLRSR